MDKYTGLMLTLTGVFLLIGIPLLFISLGALVVNKGNRDDSFDLLCKEKGGMVVRLQGQRLCSSPGVFIPISGS